MIDSKQLAEAIVNKATTQELTDAERAVQHWDECAGHTIAIRYALNAQDYAEAHRRPLLLQEASGRLSAYSFLTSRKLQHG